MRQEHQERMHAKETQEEDELQRKRELEEARLG